MEHKLLSVVEKYFDDEAKRIVNIIYDEKDSLGFNTKDMLRQIDKRIGDYYIHLELRMIGYCEAIKNNEKLSKYDYSLDKTLLHYHKYIEYIKKNKKYLNKKFLNQLYTYIKVYIDNNDVVGLLEKVNEYAKNHIKEHWDTVDCIALICLLDENFIKE